MSKATRTPEEQGFYKIQTRILPFIFIVYVTSYLDRVNVAFAAPTMSEDLGFSPSVYGFAAGIFFLAYALFEVPSNLASLRFGVRAWLTRIMFSWGLLASLQGFVATPQQFYIVRVLLGIAEAGAFPMLVLYLTAWVPEKRRAHMFGWFMSSVALAGVIGAPLSGWLLSLDGAAGLRGWQWVFVAEGAPALLLAIIVWRLLPNTPSEATWLTAEERDAVVQQLTEERNSVLSHQVTLTSVRHALGSWRVWSLGILAMFELIGLYSISLWVPIFVHDAFPDLGSVALGFVNGIPFLAAAVAMIVIGRSSDHFKERVWHLVMPMLISAVALLAAAHVGVEHGFWLLVLAAAAIYGISPVLWSLAPEFMAGEGAASGFALLNSVGAVGGFIGPYSVGRLVQDSGGDPASALRLVACSMTIAAVIAGFISREVLRHSARKGVPTV